MITAGIDIGSITTKCAIFDGKKILGSHLIFTGYSAENAGVRVFEELLAQLGLKDNEVRSIVSTGYGRGSVKFSHKAVTEITCHAAGAYFFNNKVRTIIDIGGQDSKAIAIDESGKVRDFVMNDKCAAGTGRFLEVMARALEVDLEQFGSISLMASYPSRISSLCTVFAESEVISLISKGEKRENIIAGIHESIASRVGSMALRIGITPVVMMTGGVAQNEGVVRAMEKKVGSSIEVHPLTQFAGAVGAAIIAQGLR